MAILLKKVEFDLTIKTHGEKDEPWSRSTQEKPEMELKEELKFKSLSAVEVIRKLLDYIKS